MGLLVLISVFLYIVQGFFFSLYSSRFRPQLCIFSGQGSSCFLHALCSSSCVLSQTSTSSPRKWQSSWVPVVVTMLGHLWGWGRPRKALTVLLEAQASLRGDGPIRKQSRWHQRREKARPPREDKLLPKFLLNGKRAAMCVEVPKPRKKLEFSSRFWTSFAFLLKCPQKHVASNFSILNAERTPSKLVFWQCCLKFTSPFWSKFLRC